jgi:hypothetical protein
MLFSWCRFLLRHAGGAMRAFRPMGLAGLLVLGVGWPGGAQHAQAQSAYLHQLAGQWSGQGRAATSEGETPILCDVDSQLRGETLNLRAACSVQGQSGNLGMQLYFSDMSQQFHGELTSPLNYASGGLHGRLSRGDLFLRLAARDGSEGRLLFVAEGEGQMRLLVTTIYQGSSITVLDLPLVRSN